MQDAPILAASHLGKRYGARTAIRDVSLTLRRGEVIALLGPNGAGKTTTLRLLAGLLPPSAGTVRVDGVTQQGATWPRARARIGFLTEAPGLWDRLTVRANLLVHARLQGVADPARQVARSLSRFDLEERAEDTAGTLSKGLRQKVALARALLHDPVVLLLDEPTAGLDPAITRSVRELVGALRDEGRAVLLSTHNLDEAERVADRVAVLNRTLVALDTPAALRARWAAGRVRITLASPAEPFVHALSGAGVAGVTANGTVLLCAVADAARDTPRLVATLVAAGAPIRTVVPDEPRLEDIYLTLVRGGAGRPQAGAES